MTDNERVQGRALSEEAIQRLHKDASNWVRLGKYPWGEELLNLIATIRDRDKTIAELILTLEQVQADLKDIISMPPELEHPSLTLYRFDSGDMDVIKGAELRIRDTFAQVKALTVSKQKVSTVSEVACEQTNKDSLHVARQNNPTHPTEQINRLAQEVATDMQWREGEPE